jgi:hypothetical protein
MAVFGSNWLEDDYDEKIGPLSHLLEDSEYHDLDENIDPGEKGADDNA